MLGVTVPRKSIPPGVRKPELRKPEIPALLFSTCEAINSCFLIFKTAIFFPVSFYFYFNLPYLVNVTTCVTLKGLIQKQSITFIINI